MTGVNGPALAVEPRAPRWQQVLPRLRRAILSGEIAPGTRLVPEQLAQAAGVSRGPVVDAIRRLGEEGLVTIAPNGRPFVRGLTSKHLRDLSAFRAQLEVFAARAAIAAGRHAEVDALEADVETMRQYESRDSIERLADADVSFHEHLIALGGNDVANRAWASIADFTRSLLSVSDWLISPNRQVASAHRSIVDALVRGDVPAVERAILAHYDVSTEAMTGAGLVHV
ncbi:MAG TPA: GntR family transcriptional regulator [Chloroflexota bacterium]|nr:GntR family transcriptional regulator [Chloroflexota bacterium]